MGGVKIGNRKIYILAYAHNLVLLAENKDGMKGMMEKWRYLYKKKFCIKCEEMEDNKTQERRKKVEKGKIILEREEIGGSKGVYVPWIQNEV